MFQNPLNKIFVLNVPEKFDFFKFQGLLSPKKRERLHLSEQRGVEGIFGEIILQVIAKSYKGQTSRLCYGDHGKPYFEDFNDFQFNISHSGGLVAVACSAEEIGVDIEILREVDLKISNRFFTVEEKNFVKDRKSFFYVWTRKEAYVKRDGRGMAKGLNTFNSLEISEIKTFENETFTLSICGKNAEKFEIIHINENHLKD